MPFTVPDKGEGDSNIQSVWWQEAVDVLVAGVQGIDCVVLGCGVTGGADMTPAVAAGIVISNGVWKTVTAGDATVTTADGTNPRLDLIVINSSGAIAVRAGTAAANPKPPARTANDVVLALVYVPASDTSIGSSQITDWRVMRDDLLNAQQTILLTADYTLANQTGAQKIFNTPTNGRLTLETGTYEMVGVVNIQGMSGTSGNAQFGLLGAGTATLGQQVVHLVGVDGNANTAATQTGSTIEASNTSPASAVTAGTGTAMTIRVRGTFKVTAAGTIIPSIGLVTAVGTAIVQAGSYLRVQRLGDTSFSLYGRWD